MLQSSDAAMAKRNHGWNFSQTKKQPEQSGFHYMVMSIVSFRGGKHDERAMENYYCSYRVHDGVFFFDFDFCLS